MGDWCVRTGFTLLPGETSNRAIAQVGHNSLSYWASATDANNRTIDWTDEADQDIEHIDILTGIRSCDSSATCKRFRPVRLQVVDAQSV